MTKSRERPIAGASRRSRRAHSEWNVETHMRLQSEPSSVSTRVRISSAALLVKVTASTSSGLRVAIADEIGDAARDDARLAGSGAGEDQQRSVRVKNRFPLFGVEGV